MDGPKGDPVRKHVFWLLFFFQNSLDLYNRNDLTVILSKKKVLFFSTHNALLTSAVLCARVFYGILRRGAYVYAKSALNITFMLYVSRQCHRKSLTFNEISYFFLVAVIPKLILSKKAFITLFNALEALVKKKEFLFFLTFNFSALKNEN